MKATILDTSIGLKHFYP